MRGLAGVAAFARFVGTSKITAWYWFTGKARPSLPLVLHIFHRFGASFAAQLSTGTAMPKSEQAAAQTEFHLRRSRLVHIRHWDQIHEQLFAELNKSVESVRPLAHVAKSLDIAVRALRAHFPHLCIQISRRYRLRLMQEAQAVDARCQSEIAAAVQRILAAGNCATPREIEKTLERPGLFNRKAPRRALRRILDSAAGSSPEGPAVPRG